MSSCPITSDKQEKLTLVDILPPRDAELLNYLKMLLNTSLYMITNRQNARIGSDTLCHLSLPLQLRIVLHPQCQLRRPHGAHERVTPNGMRATVQAKAPFYAIH